MKYIFTVIFLVIIGSFTYLFFNEEKVVPVFNDIEMFDTYKIVFDKAISINEYKMIFDKTNNNGYLITSIEFETEDVIINKLFDIKVNNGTYLIVLNEYINEFKNILYEHNMEEMTASIYNDRIKIKSIMLYTTLDFYEKMKKENNNLF